MDTPSNIVGHTCREGEETRASSSPSTRTADDLEHSVDAPDKVETAREVGLRLGSKLRFFSATVIYAAGVAIFRSVLLVLEILDGDGSYTGLDSTGQILVGINSSIARLIFNAVLAATALLAAGNTDIPPADDVITRHPSELKDRVEKTVLYLSAAFNTISIGTSLDILVDIVSAAMLYPQMIVVTAACIFVVSILWAGSFIGVMLWYHKSQWSSTSHLTGLITAPLDEIEQVPPVVRFLLKHLFGRLRPQQETETQPARLPEVTKASGSGKLKEIRIELQHFADIRIDEKKRHILKLLIEAMQNSVMWLSYKVFSSVLLVATFSICGLSWNRIVSEGLGLAQRLLTAVLTLAASKNFHRALLGRERSDMLNLMHGMSSLAALFQRLAVMFLITSTLQLGTSVSTII